MNNTYWTKQGTSCASIFRWVNNVIGSFVHVNVAFTNLFLTKTTCANKNRNMLSFYAVKILDLELYKFAESISIELKGAHDEALLDYFELIYNARQQIYNAHRDRRLDITSTTGSSRSIDFGVYMLEQNEGILATEIMGWRDNAEFINAWIIICCHRNWDVLGFVYTLRNNVGDDAIEMLEQELEKYRDSI